MGPEIMMATGNRLGDGFGLWLGPIVVALALITFLAMTSLGLKKTNAAARAAELGETEPINVPVQHHGPEHEVGGGFYRYTPGMYSHSYSPEEVAARERELQRA
ncbi:hypothetical protein ACGFNU_46575 [Spirillospora sp. NPDC048911]|uniref:hypothetical protein n=1 Tax=Spirillospora sp. NPDC048911 TaxID=3364527 RepID=UPI003718A797